jgi:hypothetical protein
MTDATGGRRKPEEALPKSATVNQLPVGVRERKIAMCRNLLGLRMAGSLDKLMDFFTPDARFDLIGSDAFSPFSGTCTGREAIAAKMRMLFVTFEYSDLDPYLFVVEDENVVVRWRARWRNRGTGPSAALEGIAHLIFEGDRVKYYCNFFDTAGVARLSDWHV